MIPGTSLDSADCPDTKPIDRLWREFLAGQGEQHRAALINEYREFARMLAAKLYAGRHIRELEFDDYFHYALVGLIEAIDRFDPTIGVEFKAYAGSRINGSVLNGIDRICEKQQQISLKSRLKKERLRSLEGLDNSEPSDVSLFQQLAEATIGLAIGYMLDGSGMYLDNENQPSCKGYEVVELKQVCERVTRLVESLPAQQKFVIKSHYLHQHGFDDIGRELGVSKGRVSQIHKKALAELRTLIHKDGLVDIVG